MIAGLQKSPFYEETYIQRYSKEQMGLGQCVLCHCLHYYQPPQPDTPAEGSRPPDRTFFSYFSLSGGGRGVDTEDPHMGEDVRILVRVHNRLVPNSIILALGCLVCLRYRF